MPRPLRAPARATRARRAPARRPRRGGPRPGIQPSTTRDAVFLAAAEAFSRHGFDGVIVDDIARAAGVNKAMLYYHFGDKLGLYRAVVVEMLERTGAEVASIAAEPLPPAGKLREFIARFIALADARPYLPPLMLREIAGGALHFDEEILARMRHVFQTFVEILAEGQRAGDFRVVHPVLAYLTVLGPVLVNAARERVAAQPHRRRLPMFVPVPHDELTRHVQRVALRMLEKD